MKKIPYFLVVCSIGLCLLSVNALSLQFNQRILGDLQQTQNVDGLVDDSEQPPMDIAELEWKYPPGQGPGSFQEYRQTHPLTHAEFSVPLVDYKHPLPLGSTISLLVDASLYPQIATKLAQYIDDLETEDYTVVLHTVSGGTPEEIKTWVTDQYYLGSKGMVFIGDITPAWAEVSGAVFPCDLFYMDLDGNWQDNDQDGNYEIHTAGSGDMGPEVFVARMYTSSLNYDTEATMINEYLDKAHAYRTGELTAPWRSVEYVEEDWYTMDVALDLIYGDHVSRYDYGYYTTAAGYTDQLALGQHFMQVCAHSYAQGHHFSTRPTEAASYAHVYVYSPTTRSARLRLGCDDGIKVWLNGENVYTNDRYGGWSPDAYQVIVELNEGWNQLLCKISQDGGDTQFSARFTDLDYTTFDDLIYQINNPDIYSSEAPYIRSWLLNGFHQDDPDNFWNYLSTNYLGVSEADINPHEGDPMGGKVWATYDSGYPYIDMRAYDESDYGACYAFARIYADEETSCQLWTGYDDGARIWLNGDQVLFDNRYGEFTADMTKTPVTLNAGENRLVVKISEWMGEHGFSARFCHSDGSEVQGLTYDPQPVPISYIGTWLMNGPYTNPDQDTRLSMDYLEGEAEVAPSEDDATLLYEWERGIWNGCPFDIGEFYNRGDWFESPDIQALDPPVLFYNLFACGPGDFTQDNYLAGAYIYHTTSGLITVASSKSGSMLEFNDFTQPLGQDKTFGEAFMEWFEAQAPYVQWEKEWYYGMILNGDPTLYIKQPETFSLILDDVPYHAALSDPGYDEMTGPAVAQMILNYIWWNQSQYPYPPDNFNPLALYFYGRQYNHDPALPFFDPLGMKATLQEFKPQPYEEWGYNFAAHHSENQTLMMKRICQWINYTVGTYGGYQPGHPEKVPAAIPGYGSYENWLLVKGIHTDKPCYPLPDELNIYGFWVADPYPESIGGIGQQSYKTSGEWCSTYYLPLQTGDDYEGEYVAVVEPPEDQDHCRVTLFESPSQFTQEQQYLLAQVQIQQQASPSLQSLTYEWIISAAVQGIQEALLPVDAAFAALFQETTPGTPLYVHATPSEYYLVPFTLDGTSDATVIVIRIDAGDGSFLEASWTTEPMKYPVFTDTDATALVALNNGLQEEYIKKQATTDLIYRQASPYYPEWRIQYDNDVYYITQQGELTVESLN